MAIPHEKGTRKQNNQQRPNAQDGVFSEVQGSWSLGLSPDPAPGAPGCQNRDTKTSQGSRAPKLEDANSSESTELLPGPGPLRPSRSQVHGVTSGDELLTQHSSIPGWACLWHPLTLRGVREGETSLKHPGIYSKTHSGLLNCLVWTRDCPSSYFGLCLDKSHFQQIWKT